MPSPSPSPASSLPAYAELFCLTNFSFLQGASHAEELAERAVQLDYAALAITDECSLAGVVRAHGAAKRATPEGAPPFPLLIGSHFHLSKPDGSPGLSLLALAKNREGYGNLSELITLARMREGVVKGSYKLYLDDIAAPQPAQAHLKGLPDCLLILLPRYTWTRCTCRRPGWRRSSPAAPG
jgi:error-prone DNA polymerase